MARPTSRARSRRTAVPLGAEEVRKAKQNLGWPEEPPFYIPDEALAHFREARSSAAASSKRHGTQRFDAYARDFPELAREIERRFSGELPDGWAAELPTFPADAKGLATRKASEAVMQAVARTVPELVGGSGDLDPSTYTWLKEDGDFESPQRSPATRCRGSSAAAGATPGATSTSACASTRWPRRSTGSSTTAASFPSRRRSSSSPTTCARRSAWRRWPSCTSIFVFTHDSIGLGEDGPSHQPIEQLASLRAIPNLLVIRPCDANETRWAWQTALEQRGRPTALVLTRQHVPTLDRALYAPAELLRRGAYVLNPSHPTTAKLPRSS